jgi:hypothetical protein
MRDKRARRTVLGIQGPRALYYYTPYSNTSADKKGSQFGCLRVCDF